MPHHVEYVFNTRIQFSKTCVCGPKILRTGWPKKLEPFLYVFLGEYIKQILTDFQNYFTVRIRKKFVITLSLEIPPHLKCVATLPCETSGILKATTKNETTSVTTRFKKLTTGNNVFIVSVIV